MNYNIYIIIGFIIIPIGLLYAYYIDYKRNKKEFITSLKIIGKKIFKGFAAFGFLIGLNSIYELVIPINKSHGIEFNSERDKLGISGIGENWENRKYQSDQFTTYWWKPEPRIGHFKKKIEYGLLDIKSETDYYQKDKAKGTYVWSNYDFDKDTFKYYISKPNENNISIIKNEKLKYENITVTKEISKLEFEKHIEE